MTASDANSTPVPAVPKKRFIGKARAEALRKRLAENHSGPNIEDGVIITKGTSTTISADTSN
jgi:hypothetical protein